MTGRRLPWWRRLRRRGYWLLVRLLLLAAAVLPLGWGRALGAGLGRLAWSLRPAERDRALGNLAAALPHLEAPRREAILRASAGFLGRHLWDTLAVERLLDEPASVRQVRGADGRLPMEALSELRAGGRGAFVLTLHLGCWELLGAWLARQEAAAGPLPFAVVTGTVHNPAVDRIVQDRRRASGLRVLPRDGGARPLLAHLRAGGVVGVLLDQNTRAGNLASPFLGRPAPTPAGPARLAVRYGIPLLPLAITWSAGENGHVVRHLEPLRPAEGPDDEGRVQELLDRCNESLGTFIARNPEQWVWFHDRWDQGHGVADDDPLTRDGDRC